MSLPRNWSSNYSPRFAVADYLPPDPQPKYSNESTESYLRPSGDFSAPDFALQVFENSFYDFIGMNSVSV